MRPTLLVVLALGGCGLSSSQVELFADIVDRPAGKVEIGVTAQHRHDINDVVPLDDATATLHLRGEDIALSADRGVLAADLSRFAPIVADEPFTLEISRDGATAMLAVTAPAAIDLTAPLPVFVPRSQDLTIAWATPSDAPTIWYLDADECIDGTSGSIDLGATEIVIPSSAFGIEATFETTCASALHFQRSRQVEGPNDGFEAAYFTYAHDVDLPFASTP